MEKLIKSCWRKLLQPNCRQISSIFLICVTRHSLRRVCLARLATIAGQRIFICQCHQPNLYNETSLLPGMSKLNDFSSYSYMCTCTGVVHKFCDPHGFLLRLMSSDALVHTDKCLLNSLWRAVEQLAGSLAKETKVNSRNHSISHASCAVGGFT